MPKLYERRLKASNKLESAETKLLRKAVKLHNKQVKADEKAAKKARDDRPLTDASTVDTERNDIDRFVPKNKRPSHRLPPSFLPFSLPFMGKKVDSIDWARSEIADTSAMLEERRKGLTQDVMHTSNMAPTDTSNPDALKPLHESQNFPPLNAAFILFNRQIAAHLAAQALAHHAPYRMAARYTNVAPSDVIWSNLGMNPYESRVRKVISWAATLVLIIFWAIPVAFVGAVSNIHALCQTASWLAWICKLPGVVVGIISGILPPVLLAVLMLLLPIVLRLFSKFEGVPTRTSVELSLMTRYFMFQVIVSCCTG
jgi:calcium permeable stress-gated cation channel